MRIALYGVFTRSCTADMLRLRALVLRLCHSNRDVFIASESLGLVVYSLVDKTLPGLLGQNDLLL
jgi:hypothetical protein